MAELPLFAYGTLMSQGGRGELLGGAPRSPGRVRGRLYRLPAGYPAMQLLHPDETAELWVHGEVVELPNPGVLTVLDLYEGVDEGLYRRTRVQAQSSRGPTWCWAYVMDDPRPHRGRLLPSGRWRGVYRR